jgi:hypothetical protein
MFKDVGYERAIVEKKARPGTPFRDSAGPSHQPVGTRSQSIPYLLNGAKIAICHQYLLPDGTLGASGLPDPKLIEYEGCVLFCHSSNCTCPICGNAPEDWRVVIAQMKSVGPNL